MATYNGHQEDSSGNYLLAIPNSMATTIETGTTASQAYTKGTYFYYNNRLVKATKAIASGDTLTVGTNVGYANAADELTAHLRANDTNKSEFYFDVKDGAYGFYPSASKTASQFVPFGGTMEFVNPSQTVFTINVSAGWNYVNVTGLDPNSVYLILDRTNTAHIINDITPVSSICWIPWETGQTAYKCGAVFIPSGTSVTVMCEHVGAFVYRIGKV